MSPSSKEVLSPGVKFVSAEMEDWTRRFIDIHHYCRPGGTPLVREPDSLLQLHVQALVLMLPDEPLSPSLLSALSDVDLSPSVHTSSWLHFVITHGRFEVGNHLINSLDDLTSFSSALELMTLWHNLNGFEVALKTITYMPDRHVVENGLALLSVCLMNSSSDLIMSKVEMSNLSDAEVNCQDIMEWAQLVRRYDCQNEILNKFSPSRWLLLHDVITSDRATRRDRKGKIFKLKAPSDLIDWLSAVCKLRLLEDQVEIGSRGSSRNSVKM